MKLRFFLAAMVLLLATCPLKAGAQGPGRGPITQIVLPLSSAVPSAVAHNYPGNYFVGVMDGTSSVDPLFKNGVINFAFNIVLDGVVVSPSVYEVGPLPIQRDDHNYGFTSPYTNGIYFRFHEDGTSGTLAFVSADTSQTGTLKIFTQPIDVVPSPVPEMSTTISFGALIILLGLYVVCRRPRRSIS